ncbi:MAG: glutaminase A [Methylophilus sp.]
MQEHILQQIIESLHQQYLPNNQGEIATYIPELSKANPDNFGICLVTKDGRIFEVGDSDQLFTIQSISKPFTYGMALEIYGQEKVSQHVGVEPSGDAFNSIMLEPDTNRPYNPMVNAGAITVSSLLYQHYGDDALDMMLERFSAAAGRQLSVDEAVYQSEARTGHRNRAIAHLLLNFGMVHEDVEPALDLYFKQCSILVSCKDLAVMSATLCNLGKNPVTGEEVFDITCVRDMLSIMLTCGMYDYSGQWAYKVGIPAKSGVSGGVIGVVNRQLGLSCYSPKLDKRGNSCRGIEACISLTNELGLHAFDCMNIGSSYLEAILEQ